MRAGRPSHLDSWVGVARHAVPRKGPGKITSGVCQAQIRDMGGQLEGQVGPGNNSQFLSEQSRKAGGSPGTVATAWRLHSQRSEDERKLVIAPSNQNLGQVDLISAGTMNE